MDSQPKTINSIPPNALAPENEQGHWEDRSGYRVKIPLMTVGDSGFDEEQRAIDMGVVKWGCRGEHRYPLSERHAQIADDIRSRAMLAKLDITTPEADKMANVRVEREIARLSVASQFGPDEWVRTLPSSIDAIASSAVVPDLGKATSEGLAQLTAQAQQFQLYGVAGAIQGIQRQIATCLTDPEEPAHFHNLAQQLHDLELHIDKDMERQERQERQQIERQQEAERKKQERRDKLDKMRKESGSQLPEAVDEKILDAMENPEQEKYEEGDPTQPPLENKPDVWGAMIVPPIERHKSLLATTNRVRVGDAGAPRQIQRILTDGLAFSGMQRRCKGTLLVDCSGSMNPDPELIAEIVRLSSAVTVGLYGGLKSAAYAKAKEFGLAPQPNERDVVDHHGALLVVGKDGMVARDVQRLVKQTFNGANLVDGPALKWLSRQIGPRIWVGDAYVVGRNGGYASIPLQKECFDICARHSIIRVPSLIEAIAYLRSRR